MVARDQALAFVMSIFIRFGKDFPN